MHNSAQLRCFENGNDDFGVEAFWIGDAARVGYFVPLNGPLNGHPPSLLNDCLKCACVSVQCEAAGTRRAKCLLHLFALLPSPRAHLWRDRLHLTDRYVACDPTSNKAPGGGLP